MTSRPSIQQRSLHGLGIGFLILSLVHTPLPQPDYHNLRHHDAPGEVCNYHDHLLRWHPGAGIAQDVAVLHWHWFLPLSRPADPYPSGKGPAFHAHVPEWQASSWDSGPRLVPDSSSRFVARPAPCPLDLASLNHLGTSFGPVHAPGPRPPLAFSATFAPSTSLASLFQRWVC
jgi:hypothetical protein